jgi:hypothetical protein
MRLQLHIENDQIKSVKIDRDATEKAGDRIHKNIKDSNKVGT